MAWTLSTSGAHLFARAGVNAGINLSGSNILNTWSDQAEDTLSMRTRKNWSGIANYSGAVAEVITDMIAMKIVTNNQDDYRGEQAQTILDVLNDNVNKLTKELSEQKNQEVME